MPERSNSVQSPLAAHGRELLSGKVFLVGAGPGDPGLLTLRGHECLQKADVVLYDGLASEDLLDFAPSAECISVGKHGQIPIWTQSNINDKMVDLARQGKRVVRLKGGDPAVFARTAEELDVLIAEKIPFEVVPGITAALAAASYVGIPITHRHHASAVALVTGQQQASDTPQPIDWHALAHFPGTIVFYMGVTTVGEWSSKLIEAGKSPETPAAIVRRCTWSDQSVIRCQLADVAEHLTPASKMRPPVIVIVGTVAAIGKDFDWFSARPLHGCGVLVTRSHAQNESIVRSLRELGAEVLQQPSISISPPNDRASLDKAIDVLKNKQVHGVSFSSANGVDGLLEHVFQCGYDARLFGGVRLASVGRTTAEQLKRHGLRADIVPPSVDQDASGLVAALSAQVHGESWLVTKTNRSGPTLSQGLSAAGAQVTECLCYESTPITELKPTVAAALKVGRVHYCTITSSLIAEATYNLLYNLLGDQIQRVQPIALSDAIAQRLNQLGWPAVRAADENSTDSLVSAITAAWSDAH